MSDIIDINVAQTVEEVTINVVDNVIQVNINQVNGGGGVPYTGATSDVDLGEFGLLTGNVEFDNTPTNIPTTAGSVYWNDSDGTLDLILKGGNVKLQVGQEQVIRVVNKTATNINLLESNYQAVRVTGAQGQRLKVDLAQATTDNLSAETIGLVTETINNNQEGFITTSGLVRNINTTGSLQGETWADGDIVYLSPTTAGRITKVKPEAPNHLVIIGYVVSAHATQGSIFVKVDNGYELDELHNVKIDTPLDNQGLVYNSTLEVWENKTIGLQEVTDEGNETTNDVIFRLDADKYLKINTASQKIELWDETIDDTIPITHWDKDSFYIKDASGNQMSISAGYTNNLTVDGSSAEILGGNIVLNQSGSSLNLISEAVQITVGLDTTQYFYDKISINGVDYTLPTGATSQIATLLDIPTIDATPTDGSSNAVSSNGVFDALALKQDKNRSETFVLSKANGTFGSHTGTTAETVLFSADISANEFTAGDFMKVMLDITKVGTAGTANVRLRAGTTGTTSDALIASLFLTATVLDAGFIRERFHFVTGNTLSGIANNYTSNPTDIAPNTAIKQSTSLTPSNAWKITVSVALANSADTVSCVGYRVSKIKSI